MSKRTRKFSRWEDRHFFSLDLMHFSSLPKDRVQPYIISFLSKTNHTTSPVRADIIVIVAHCTKGFGSSSGSAIKHFFILSSFILFLTNYLLSTTFDSSNTCNHKGLEKRKVATIQPATQDMPGTMDFNKVVTKLFSHDRPTRQSQSRPWLPGRDCTRNGRSNP